jgi:uncharacterized LabA/DUF88 family protein
MISPKVAIFVDGANVDIASKTARIGINYVLLKIFLAKARPIAIANYYNSKAKDVAERAFYAQVENADFQLVCGPRKTENRSQKEIDVQIAVDMVSEAYDNSFGVAVLVSGDGDLAPAVRKLVSMKKEVEVASFDDPKRREFSWSLKTAATRTIDLTANILKIKL